MTTLTQSDLDDLRRRAEASAGRRMYRFQGDPAATVLALLNHIAQLTQHEQNANGLSDKLACIVREKAIRIAELEAQSSAQFVAGMRKAAEIAKEHSRKFLEIAGWVKHSDGNLRHLQTTDSAQANAFVSKSNGAGVIRAAILSAASALEQKEQG